jgi:hypothetical protein
MKEAHHPSSLLPSLLDSSVQEYNGLKEERLLDLTFVNYNKYCLAQYYTIVIFLIRRRQVQLFNRYKNIAFMIFTIEKFL